MTLDGFLTVLALLAAIYAVLSPVQRLRASLSWRAQMVVAIPACIAILAYELLDAQPPACPSLVGSWCRLLILGGADPGMPRKFAFLVAFVWLMAALFIHQKASLSLGQIPQLSRVTTSLVDDDQFNDAFRLIEPNLPLIARASRRKTRRQRLHDWLVDFGPIPPGSFREFMRPPGPRAWTGENLPEWAARIVRHLARAVPAYAAQEQAASDILNLLLNSPILLDHMARRRPYFAVSLARQDAFGTRDFIERFLTRLIADPASALYQELANNDIAEGPIGYALPSRNRLLHALFADARVADDLSAWAPIGNYVERLLDGEERAGYWTWLNGTPRSFDRERFGDPVFMAMFFFDIMVTSAARQGIEYDMWLSYLPHFVDRLEAGYDSSGEGINPDAEFPTRAARLLYELFNILESWVGLYSRLPEASPLRRMPDRLDHGTMIPQSAALALGRALARVAGSANIDRGVVKLLHDRSLRAIRAVHDDTMRRFVIQALLDGGQRKAPPGHLRRLSRLFDDIDPYDRHELADYEKALRAQQVADAALA